MFRHAHARARDARAEFGNKGCPFRPFRRDQRFQRGAGSGLIFPKLAQFLVEIVPQRAGHVADRLVIPQIHHAAPVALRVLIEGVADDLQQRRLDAAIFCEQFRQQLDLHHRLIHLNAEAFRRFDDRFDRLRFGESLQMNLMRENLRQRVFKFGELGEIIGADRKQEFHIQPGGGQAGGEFGDGAPPHVFVEAQKELFELIEDDNHGFAHALRHCGQKFRERQVGEVGVLQV